VPAEDGFGLDDYQVLSPARPEAMDPDPQGAIGDAESRAGIGAKSYEELMTKDKVLESNIATRPEDPDEGADKQKLEFEHSAG